MPQNRFLFTFTSLYLQAPSLLWLAIIRSIGFRAPSSGYVFIGRRTARLSGDNAQKEGAIPISSGYVNNISSMLYIFNSNFSQDTPHKSPYRHILLIEPPSSFSPIPKSKPEFLLKNAVRNAQKNRGQEPRPTRLSMGTL